MKLPLYEKYTFGLLLSRFGLILFCVSIFGIFQEFTANSSVAAILTYSQLAMLSPFLLPQLLFQFMPFVHLGTLFFVLNELYNNNELISFKALGFSYRKLFNVFAIFTLFVLVITIALALIYPKTNSFFLSQRNLFGATNFLQHLEPGKINSFGNKYKIFFNSIDKQKKLHNVTITTSMNDDRHRIIYADDVVLGYNDNNQLVARCRNVDVLDMNLGNAKKKLIGKENEEPKKQKITNIKMEGIDLLFDTIFKNAYSSMSVKEKKIARMTNLKKLWKKYNNKETNTMAITIEWHSRCYAYYAIITTITAVCCLLLRRQTNRIPAKRLTMFVILLAGAMSLSRAFELDFFYEANIINAFYIQFVVVSVVCLYVLLRQKSVKMKHTKDGK